MNYKSVIVLLGGPEQQADAICFLSTVPYNLVEHPLGRVLFGSQTSANGIKE